MHSLWIPDQVRNDNSEPFLATVGFERFSVALFLLIENTSEIIFFFSSLQLWCYHLNLA